MTKVLKSMQAGDFWVSLERDRLTDGNMIFNVNFAAEGNMHEADYETLRQASLAYETAVGLLSQFCLLT